MTEKSWRPLFLRESGEQSDFDALHEDIPPWLEGSIWRWLMDRAAEGASSMIDRLERRMHVELASDGDRPLGRQHTSPAALIERYWKGHGPKERLTLLDAILADMRERGSTAFDAGDTADVAQLVEGARRLHTILTEGGSVWGVHLEAPAWCLVRRVNNATAQLVETAAAADTDAARKIKSAWVACYRHDPNYDIAYRDAVLAVEAVSIPATVPDSTRASLGQVLTHIRDTAERWSVSGLDAKEIASADTLVEMMKTLWHNQQRHARSDGTIANVSREEAEAAVSLAVTLVHWFTAGLVTKKDQ